MPASVAEVLAARVSPAAPRAGHLEQQARATVSAKAGTACVRVSATGALHRARSYRSRHRAVNRSAKNEPPIHFCISRLVVAPSRTILLQRVREPARLLVSRLLQLA